MTRNSTNRDVPMLSHSYFLEVTVLRLDSTIIFLGTDTVEDVVLKSKDLVGDNWTRSASDYGAPVFEVNRFDTVRHVLVIWFEATELYALDLEKNSISLVSQKVGLVDVTHAFVGMCE